MSEPAYEFDGLPLSGISPGTSLLLVGPPDAGTRDFGLRLLDGPANEGSIVVTTDKRATRIIEDCARLGIETSPERTSIIDCVGRNEGELPARVHKISGPSDLTGIGMRASDSYQQMHRGRRSRIRMGFYSLSTLLLFGSLRNVSRFVHVFANRIDNQNGLGVFHLNPAIHDDQEVSTLAQFCSGRIDIQADTDGPMLRTRGLPGQPTDWTRFE